MAEFVDRSLTLEDVASLVGGTWLGDESIMIKALTGITEATEGDITFVDNRKYLRLLEDSKASAVILSEEMQEILDASGGTDKSIVLVQNPDLARAQLLEYFYPLERMVSRGVHETAVVGEDVQPGEDVAIAPYVVIDDGCSVGNGTTVCNWVGAAGALM